MRIRRVVELSLCVVLLCTAFGAGVRADSWDKKTIVTFSNSVEIPGRVLLAGTYVFKLANTASDRHIVQIWNGDETQILATIMAIQITAWNSRIDPCSNLMSAQAIRPWPFGVGSIRATTLDRNLFTLDTDRQTPLTRQTKSTPI